MGFLDELKRLTHPYEDEMEDDYDEDEDVYEDEEEPEDVEPTPPPREEPSRRREREYQEPPRRNSGGKVVNIHATTQLQVVLVKPERYENASEIADHLRDKRTVVLNLEKTQKDVAAVCWTSCPAWPTPRRGRSKRWPFRPISSRPIM